MSFKAIIFDCDGVIVDTETLSNNILKRKLAHYDLHLSDKKMHELFSGLTAEDNVKTAEQLLNHPLPGNFIEELRKEFHATIKKDLSPIKDIPELLKRINVPIAMATNAHRPAMDFKLERIGLTETFAKRFCIEDVINPKPHPELYLMAAKAINTEPKDCLVIEDSAAGITAGVAAGMTVYGFSECTDDTAQAKAGAAMSFPTIAQLIQQLEKIGLLD